MRNLRILVSVAAVFVTTNFASAQTWTQTSAPVTNWTAITCAADGVKLAAFADGDVIYTSTNSGATWNPRTNAPSGILRVAASADGTKLTVTVGAGTYKAGGIYRSVNSGLTWTQTSAPTNTWVSIASSADGDKLTALAAYASQPSVYTSSDGGNTWNTNASPYDRWSDLACSADGKTLVACGALGTAMVSTNFGSSWTSTNLDALLISAASSADGNRLMVVGSSKIYVSTNSGLAWNQIAAPSIGRLASSADGSRLVAIGYSSYPTNLSPVYVSTNFGVIWMTNTPPAINYGASVKPVASSADGNKLFAAVNGGGIWTSQTTPTPQMSIASTDRNLALSWIIPSANFVLQQNSDLNTANWTDVTNAPVLNLTNLRKEVTLPLTDGAGFYRLTTQ